MTAVTVDLVIEQGARFYYKFVHKDQAGSPIDNTGKEARMQIRKTKEEADYEILLNSVGSGDGTITLGGANGEVELELGATKTKDLSFVSGVYDLEVYNPGDADDVLRLVEGKVTVSVEVTR